MVAKFLWRASLVLLALILCFAEISMSDSGGGRTKKRWVRSKHGLRALMMLSRDRGNMEKYYKNETRNFHRVNKAVEHDIFTKGERAFEIRKKYGDPVVEIPWVKDGHVKWVYKEGASDFFTGDKVFLVFGPDDKLVEWGFEPGRGEEKE